MSGALFTFEGTEGSGKSTQIERLAHWLDAHGREVVRVREPGGTPLSEAVRNVLLQRRESPVDPWAELALYVAARAQLVSQVIRPALQRGAVVLADRYIHSSVAYQGGARGLGARKVETLNRWATGDLQPEQVFLFDLDPAIGLSRIREGRGEDSFDRIERESLRFHRKVRAAYRRLARRDPDRFTVLDAAADASEIEATIREVVRTRLTRLTG